MAAGAVGVAYVDGDLEHDVEAPPNEVLAAVEAGLVALELPVLAREASTHSARLSARTRSDRELTVALLARDDGGTHVSIRVGAFRSGALGRRLRDEIDARLAE